MAEIIIVQPVSNEIFEVFVKLPLKMLKGTAGFGWIRIFNFTMTRNV